MIRVISMCDNPTDGIVINTTSRSNNWSKGLSPFFLKPIDVPAQNVENAWQFSKVYKDQVDPEGNPSSIWYNWREIGFKTSKAVRYPKGKGAIPLYSFWNGSKLTYIEARRYVYIPTYANAISRSFAFNQLRTICNTNNKVYLQDFDGYDHIALGMSFDEVIDCQTKKMGHAFVLAMMLEGYLVLQ